MSIFLKDNAQAFIDSNEFAINTRKQYLRMLLAIGTYESKIGEPIYRMSPDDMYKGFSIASQNADRIGKLRSLIARYFGWLSDRGVDVSIGTASLFVVGQKSEEHLTTLQYFYSIHHLLSKISHDIAYVSSVEDKMPSDYRMLNSLFILAWYGIKLEDALLVKKLDILRTTGFIIFGGKITDIDSAAYEILKECAIAESYTKGVAQYRYQVGYYKTEMLFRTDAKEMTPKAIRDTISKFNAVLRGKSTPYSVNKIYWSGKFIRAYLFEKNGGLDGVSGETNLMKVFETLFDEIYDTRNKYQDRQQEYKRYKSAIENAH